MSTVKVTINNIPLEVSSESTIMDAATLAGVDVPRLCFLKGLNETSACRICVVEVEGIRGLKNSCTVKVFENMKVKTNSDKVKQAIRNNLVLLAANHKFECWRCPREQNCEFLHLLRRYNVPNVVGEDLSCEKKKIIINITDSLIIDSSKCVMCGRCIAACEKFAGTSVLNYNKRGFISYVGPAMNHSIDDSGCIYCGKCIQYCPTGALRETDSIDEVLSLLDKEEYYVVAQVAPSVRATLGEEFGYPIGTNVEGKMYRALEKLGFEDLTDTNFAADVTIMEEGTEFIGRLKKRLANDPTVLPMFTSCSPGWIRYIEIYYPEYLPNLSTCKSPQQMQGALIKNYYAAKLNIPKDKIRVVSIMPCIAKKSEAKLPEMEVEGVRDVDYVLTTRELARMIRRSEIDFRGLEELKPKGPMAQYTGAGVIFGATGGVMEAALRTVKEILENKNVDLEAFSALRGVSDGIKEATIDVAGLKVTVAVVNGSANIPEMMKRIKANPDKYAFVEFMACTGGCVNGGGQPIVNAKIMEQIDVRKARAQALYNLDSTTNIRKSHDNPAVKALYQDFLKEPGGHISHQLLHTHYHERTLYEKK
ncbi:MAG TPA: ferredoxin [Acholeplasmatales bacterium]|nr:ferredoxin [Acholeplasmatales bacterium]